MREFTQIHEMTISRLRQAYQKRELSPVEVEEALRKRRERIDETINSFCAVEPESSQRDARRAERRLESSEHPGLLAGIPVAIKDDLALAGWALRKGSLSTTDEPVTPERQSPSVTGVRRAGGLIVGKTSLPEFGWKATCDSPLTGVTRNPWDLERTSGGSSGGNAAALATGLIPASLGTDIGGSVRIPAAFCGVVGFKPTQTIMSGNADAKTGILLHSGPMTRTVEDIALVMDTMGAKESRRSQRASSHSGILGALEHDVLGLRVGLSPGLGFAEVDPEIDALIKQAAVTLASIGAIVEEVDVFDESPIPTYEALYVPQLTAELDALSPEQREHLDPGFVAVARSGRDFSAADMIKALGRRRAMMERTFHLHQHYDVILSATVPIQPFGLKQDVPDGKPDHKWWTWTPLTATFNITGQPALSVPCGRTRDGLPVGLQITGPHNRDDLVLAVGHAYQMVGYCPSLAPLD